MSVVYADRAFISVNGAPLIDVQSASMKRNYNAKPVPSMTPDFFNTGYVQGNTDIDIDVEVAVENALPSPKIETLPFATASVALVFVTGADQYVCSGLFMKNVDQNASGIGSEVKKSFQMGALKVTDSVGNSASVFNIQTS
jgi:hypothetical protein